MFSNADVELGQRNDQKQRDANIRAARAGIGRGGTSKCVDCDEAISLERKRVAPFASRCLECQQARENS